MVKTSALVLANLITLSALAQAEDVLESGQTVLPVNQPESIPTAATEATTIAIAPATSIAGMYAQENYVGVTERPIPQPSKHGLSKSGNTLPKPRATSANTRKHSIFTKPYPLLATKPHKKMATWACG